MSFDRKRYQHEYYLKQKTDLVWVTKHRAKCIKTQQEVRDALLGKLGNKCYKCGFTDPRALQVDHIEGGGHAQRLQARSTSNMYRNMLKDPDLLLKYQCLCANCNWIKRYENRECGEHQRWT